MPPLGPPGRMLLKGKHTVFGTDTRLLLRPVRIEAETFDRYFAVVDQDYPRYFGEVLMITMKERGPVQAPFTYATLWRGVQHIEDSQVRRLHELRSDIERLMRFNLQLKGWKVMTESQRRAITDTLVPQAERLQRAHTERRLEAGERIGQAASLRDSLGRPNPLIARGHLRLAEASERGQLERDELSLQASRRRLAFAMELAGTITRELEALFQALNGRGSRQELDLVRKLLDLLVIKPFGFAANYSQRVLEGQGFYPDSAESIGQAFAAELGLINIEHGLAALREDPAGVGAEDLGLLLSGLPDLEFDEPYRSLAGQIGDFFKTAQILQTQGKPQDMKRVIEQIEALLRYRTNW